MHHNARRRRVWDSKQGWPAGLSALWTVCPVSYPLKPPSAGGPGQSPLCEVSIGPRFRVSTAFRPFGLLLLSGWVMACFLVLLLCVSGFC